MPEHTPAPTPSRSLYGFFMFVFSKIILIIYCIWAVTPDNYLHYINIYYYPQKYWSTAVPIQCLVALTIFAFFVYPSSNLMLTTSIDSMKTVRDSFSQYDNQNLETNYETLDNICICKDHNKCMKHSYIATPKEFRDNTVPQLKEYDVSYISRKLYHSRNKKIS
ncbi:phosphatidylinositol N-acetylglucosaminyltransferase subunit P [Bicyclus anynana]|uniref:Phosphatidylinositol N-acetylglucosaminyltransferase subunit P n=1 Tax=Bicyclus anynana TaxID=110368 RepID=A0A6J1NS46_BICAN|nr:phosphatidylinositol N-acetylglucosaminyltransferase subunit P [Bicyclus anynana]XP_023947683.2 phosphatidylinositol N-acetylglucosaminyltransferase subunit P [Bicyclus anynana]